MRARLGVRGVGFPLDSNVNHFLLTEFGNNGITRPGGGSGSGSANLTDASVTLNHIKGARIRMGQFKYPGAEEGLQAIHTFDYVNFTNVTNQILLERHFDADGSAACNNAADPAWLATCRGGNKPNGPVGAFRDIGVQVFDSFRGAGSGWEHSYAAMVGNGITRGDNDENKDFYLYWSSEQIYGGQCPRREGMKLLAWYQAGKRTIFDSAALAEAGFDRKRSGRGVTYRRNRHRAGLEYVTADGMIFNSTDGAAVAGTTNGGGVTSAFNVLSDDEANGWYAHLGYAMTPSWELDLRYDTLNRGTKTTAGERKFDTVMLGAQYFFNRKSRLIMNYEARTAEAPGLASNAAPNRILDAMDDRISLQFLAIF